MESSSNRLNNPARDSVDENSLCKQKKCDCLKLIQFIVDSEATPEEQKFFEKHIVDCIPCFEQYNLDKTIKESLKFKINQIQVPSELLQSIKSSIS